MTKYDSIFKFPLCFFIMTLATQEAPAKNITPSTTLVTCGKTMVQKSTCMIKAMLDDVNQRYGDISGGGISELRQLATYQYRVSLPQEERIIEITYTFDIKSTGELKITQRSESTRSPLR